LHRPPQPTLAIPQQNFYYATIAGPKLYYYAKFQIDATIIKYKNSKFIKRLYSIDLYGQQAAVPAASDIIC